ncbi:Aldo/keto reductase [Choiromyces venosus 120613-1]|uniref:Aldo/keto reductase n=1 Tax=Choiromyces venosus 120613-1 TaxID=1336337 RepID=A0A3N4J5N5_9PEZI|nr:Aldo/keto reductase [Choiromyces venosus 120613-1]
MAGEISTKDNSPRSRIILGCMTFGPNPESGARVNDLETYKSVLTHFHSRNYHELDTARTYCAGEQEAFTAAAISGANLHFKLATKLYPNVPRTHTPESIREKVLLSLKQLGVEKVDIWYLHAPDRSIPFSVTLKAVDELYKEGRFGMLGLSNYTAFEVAEIVTLCKERGWVRPKIYQGMYNAITRALESELLVACRRYGLDVVVYNPLAGGFFTGKYQATTPPATGRFSNVNPQQGAMYRDRYFQDHYFTALKLIEPVVAKHNLTMAETALRWLVHHSALKIKDGNDGIIIGVSSLDQLKQNLDAAEKGPLPEEVVEVLDTAWAEVKGRGPNYWHLKLEYTYSFDDADA